jgi:hypothetical protein
MNWSQWAILAASMVGAATGLVSSYLAYVKHRKEKAKPMEEESARWNLMVRPFRPEYFLAELRRSIGEDIGVRLIQLRLTAPRGAFLFRAKYEPPGRYVRGDNIGASKIILGLDFKPVMEHGPGGLRSGDYSSITFFIGRPPKSRFRSSITRAEIVVDAEDISSARRHIRIKAKSHEIDWTASSTTATTVIS